MTSPQNGLGIRANLAQRTLLVIVNALVGALVGMERSILPVIAEEEFFCGGPHGGAFFYCRIWHYQGHH